MPELRRDCRAGGWAQGQGCGASVPRDLAVWGLHRIHHLREPAGGVDAHPEPNRCHFFGVSSVGASLPDPLCGISGVSQSRSRCPYLVWRGHGHCVHYMCTILQGDSKSTRRALPARHLRHIHRHGSLYIRRDPYDIADPECNARPRCLLAALLQAVRGHCRPLHHLWAPGLSRVGRLRGDRGAVELAPQQWSVHCSENRVHVCPDSWPAADVPPRGAHHRALDVRCGEGR
mmetsp:Transcript_53060/g.151141  ORF Transcript_53060/g.151141 Transcript_53060/m.151141 type:complete len:231 (-) Transcript_53060:492-1184(-)